MKLSAYSILLYLISSTLNLSLLVNKKTYQSKVNVQNVLCDYSNILNFTYKSNDKWLAYVNRNNSLSHTLKERSMKDVGENPIEPYKPAYSNIN